MKLLTISDIRVGVAPIVALEGQSRHENETAAVCSLVTAMMGQAVVIGHHDNGAPYLEGFSGLYISISHSREQVAVAIASHPVGIDTETARTQLERIKHKFLSEQEQQRFVTLNELLLAWSIKEAAYKVAGIRGINIVGGIRIDSPYQVSVTGCSSPFKIRVIEQFPDHVTVLVTP